MALDLDRIRQRQRETQPANGNFWKPKKGKNYIRVYKFTHVVTDKDVAAGLFTKEQLGKKIEDLDRPITVSYGVGKNNRPVLTTPEIQAKYDTLSASKKKEDQAFAEKIKPNVRYCLNIVDMSEAQPKLRVFQASKGLYNDIFDKVTDEDEYGEKILGSTGRDFRITYNPDAPPVDKYEVIVRSQDKSVGLDPALQEKVVDFYSEDGFAKLGFGDDAAEEDDDDDDDDAPPAKGAKKGEKSAAPKKEDPDNDDDD